MNKKLFITIMLAIAFGLGYAFNNVISTKTNEPKKMKKVTGIGGIFFKCKDPEKVKEWYKKHLGFETDQYGTIFRWRQSDDSTKKGITQWSPFSQTTKYFDPSTKDFMINYSVENLDNTKVKI